MPIVSTDVRSTCMHLPRQGRPLVLDEGSRCAQNEVQPIQGSLTHGNDLVPQILQALLVQSACATIPHAHAIAQSVVMDVEGGNDDKNCGDASRSLQFFGSQPPTCLVK